MALWILGSVMCALGISAMRERFGIGRANLTGTPLGLLATALVLSGLFGWTLLLTPIVDALGGAGVGFARARRDRRGRRRDGRQVGDRVAFVPSTPNGFDGAVAVDNGPIEAASETDRCVRG